MNTNQFSAPSAININKFDNLNSVNPQTSNNPIQPQDKNYQVFSSGRTPIAGFDFGKLLFKIVCYTVLLLPVLLIIISIGIFLQQNNFDIMVLGNYPSWMSKVIEDFVKSSIVPMTQKEY